MRNNIETLRKLNGLSQMQLAIKLGVSVSTIYAYEAGSRRLNDEMIIKLANLFECSTDEVLDYVPIKSISYNHVSLFVDNLNEEINALQEKVNEFSKTTKSNKSSKWWALG